MSLDVFLEVAEVLARPKFARVLAGDRQHEILELPTAAALWVEPAERVEGCRDAKDNRYLELALAARATAIVSGDAELLTLDPWRGIRVLRPAELNCRADITSQGCSDQPERHDRRFPGLERGLQPRNALPTIT